jgi:hypothetical protein
MKRAAVLLLRTALLRSVATPDIPAAPIAVDAEAVAARLSGALRFRTISFEEPSTQ